MCNTAIQACRYVCACGGAPHPQGPLASRKDNRRNKPIYPKLGRPEVVDVIFTGLVNMCSLQLARCCAQHGAWGTSTALQIWPATRLVLC